MLFRKIIMNICLLLIAFAVAFQPAISQDTDMNKQKKDEVTFYVTEVGTEYKLIGWETDIIYNPFTFTWQEWQEPVYKKKKVRKVYPVPASEFDRPPVFGKECLTAEDKVNCTNQSIQEFSENEEFEYPQAAEDNMEESLEYVTFKLTKDGKIEDISVLSKTEACEECSDVAADIVDKMEGQWYPAWKDGEKVAVKITLPVRFDLVNVNR